MSEIVVALLTWIAGEVGLVAPPPPSIAVVPKDEISVRAFGRGWQAGDDVMALYDAERATVYLPESFSSGDMRSRSLLVHELVHHVQFAHRVPFECSATRERQAYELTAKWLRAQGVDDPYAVMQTDEYTIVAMSACSDFGLV